MADMVALYIRLSLEDEDVRENTKEESGSVTNQRELLKKYLSEHEEFAGIPVREFFDDGYTGRNFERPGFQEMIAECRMGNIGCIIVKDLSRLGRNYVEVGNLLEQVFPFLGVRVISVNDGYDSNAYIGQTGGIDVAFKNLVYNLYSRDLSHKVKSAVETRMKRGEYIGPYGFFGYEKDPQDIHKLVIDKEAAVIVRRIFQMVIDGMKRKDIVNILNREGVPTPAVYKKRKGCTRDWFPEGKKSGWNTSMIAKIIRDERYAGDLVSGKMAYESFDSKHQVRVDKADWIVVKDNHEGIVTHEEFEKANANMRSVVQGKKKNPANKSNYSVIICPYCGLRLRPGKTENNYMKCPTGRHNKDSECRNVRIRRKVAEDTLLALVRNQAKLLIDAEQILKEKQKKMKEKPGMDMELLKSEMKKLEAGKISDYEKYREGKLTRESFLEKKKVLDVRKEELTRLMEEAGQNVVVEDMGSREFEDAFHICEYAGLETFDKGVIASLISSAKVLGEDRMEVTWKHQDIYEKIFENIRS